MSELNNNNTPFDEEQQRRIRLYYGMWEMTLENLKVNMEQMD